MTIRQLVAAEFGVTPTRVSQYVKSGMPLDNADRAIRWVQNNYRVKNWGGIIQCPPSSIPNFHSDQKIRFVR